MPYANGETPVVGDYVKNKWGIPGTVTRVHEARDGHEDISVRWDDGATQGLYTDFKAGLGGLLRFLFVFGFYHLLSHPENTPKSARNTVNPDTHCVSVRCWGNMCVTYLMTSSLQNLQGHGHIKV
jgi:hypothetical protein